MGAEGGGGECTHTDNNESCPGWAKEGYCTDDQYKEYMDKNCAKSCKCTESVYNCEEVGVNYQKRVGSSVTSDVSSWKDCVKLCQDSSTCNYWVWNNSGAGVYKHRCALMTSFGNRAADVNTVAGPKNCS